MLSQLISEKRLKDFRGFFDDEEPESGNFIEKGEVLKHFLYENSGDTVGEAFKFQEGHDLKKKTLLITENLLIYFSKFLGLIKFIKFVDLNEVYAHFDKADDKLAKKNHHSGWSIYLFRNSKSVGFRFNDWTTYLKFKESIKKRSILINFYNAYTFIGYLKSGGFSQVSIIEHNLTHNRYAAKMFLTQDLRNNKKNFGRELLKNEIFMLKLLKSDYISNLQEVYELNDKIVLVMELLGEDLISHLKNLGRSMKTSEIKRFMKKALEALSFIHGKGVIHRDIKPENIMFDKEGKTIKIIDFGLSTHAELDHYYRHQKCGTLQYMAPEMKSGNLYDSKADVYSLGVTFFLLLSGDIRNSVIVEDFPYQVPDYALQSIAPLAIDLLQKMLQSDPALRITSAEALNHRWLEKEIRLNYEIQQNFDAESNQMISAKTFGSSPLENMMKFSEMCCSINAFDLKRKKPFS